MSARYFNTIEASSVPVYGWFSNYWDQADWVQWHKKLVATYDLAIANEKFLKAWNESPIFAVNIGFRNAAFASNADFITYAKENNFYDALFSGILGTLFKIESTAISATQDVTSAVSNVAASTKSFSSYLFPLAVVGLIVFAIFYSKKHKLI